MSTANCIISEPELTQQYERASESEVANLPCGRVYIPLGSQPLAQSYIRYIHVTRASCPKTPCKCMTKTPHKCMPRPVSSLGLHSKNSSAPTPYHTISPDVLILTTQVSGWCKPICICRNDPTNSRAIVAILHVVACLRRDRIAAVES